MSMAAPWRTFVSYKGQRHYSGCFWSATQGDLILYESRLELARLLFADFDRAVRGIVAQPFLLEAEVDGRRRRHVPDFLLLTEALPIVVDVKPASRVSKPDIAFVLAWTRRVVEARGWVYEVWSEPPPIELANVRLLAGYRREWLFDPAVLAELREADLEGMSLGAVRLALPHWQPEIVAASALHLLWQKHFLADLADPLDATTVLRVAA
ncbi:transposase [Amycolatopsis sp. WAC 01375]|nr:transposase [Amycolatopsis sp. WAC 01375]